MHALDLIRKDLTEEDISLITFFRHSHCHIQLHYIWYKAKIKDGKIISVIPPFDPNAKEIAAKVIAQYKNQNDIAFNYADKLCDKLIQLKEAVINATAI
jgi:hypothetical protein